MSEQPSVALRLARGEGAPPSGRRCRARAEGRLPLLAAALPVSALLLAWPAAAQSTPEGTKVLGVRAGNACLKEQVRITGFALAREESGASIPFDGYRVTEILVAEGDTVTAGQEILRAVRQPDGGAQRPQTPETVSLRAPIAGRVTRIGLRLGQVTGAAAGLGAPTAPAAPAGLPDPQVRVMADAGTELLVDVPSPYAAKIRTGTAARIVPDEGAEIRGSVRVPVSEVDPRTQLGRARISLDPPTALRPGQFASAVLETARDCGVAVPRAAVSYQNGVPTVQVLNGSRVETRSVRIGLSDESNVQIREGLSDGEPVVANAGTALRPGDRVTPVITGQVGASR